jgi:rubrerythrin
MRSPQYSEDPKGHEDSFLQRIHPHAEWSISQPWGAVSSETWGDAQGHLDHLKQVGDPVTGLPIGDSVLNLKAAIAGQTHEYTDMYPGMAKSARPPRKNPRTWRG